MHILLLLSSIEGWDDQSLPLCSTNFVAGRLLSRPTLCNGGLAGPAYPNFGNNCSWTWLREIEQRRMFLFFSLLNAIQVWAQSLLSYSKNFVAGRLTLSSDSFEAESLDLQIQSFALMLVDLIKRNWTRKKLIFFLYSARFECEPISLYFLCSSDFDVRLFQRRKLRIQSFAATLADPHERNWAKYNVFILFCSTRFKGEQISLCFLNSSDFVVRLFRHLSNENIWSFDKMY